MGFFFGVQGPGLSRPANPGELALSLVEGKTVEYPALGRDWGRQFVFQRLALKKVGLLFLGCKGIGHRPKGTGQKVGNDFACYRIFGRKGESDCS